MHEGAEGAVARRIRQKFLILGINDDNFDVSQGIEGFHQFFQFLCVEQEWHIYPTFRTNLQFLYSFLYYYTT